MAVGDHGVTPLDLELVTGGRVLSGDDRAGLLLDLAAAAAVSVMGWCPWPSRTETVTLDCEGTDVLTLPSILVTDVAEVIVDGDVVDVSGYRWSRVGLLERVGGRWPRGYRRAVVTFTHGADVLPDVQGVILSLAGRLSVSAIGQTSMRAGGVAETYAVSAAGLLMQDDRDVLARYSIRAGGRGV